MKILVLGASGQVGNRLMEEGRRRRHAMTGTFRSHPLAGLEPLDLLDAAATRELVASTRPDWVVNCATWAWVDGNELDPARARQENVDTVRAALAAARDAGARWCYLSSSYVFDGTKEEPYLEDDPISPISVYGRTKAEAEALSRETFGPAALIVRTVVVWGPDPQEKNFVFQVVRHARRGEILHIPSDQLGNPTFGPDLAAAILHLMERGEGGLWNVAGPEERLDRLAFARLLCRELGLDDGFLRPATTAELEQAAPRPLNGALATGKLTAAGLALRPTAEALLAWRRGEWEWPWPAS